MKKVLLNGTYAYSNFISENEKDYLLDWVNENKYKFPANLTSKNRHFTILKNMENSPLELVEEIKNRIIELENIQDWLDEPLMHDYIGINSQGGAIHPHTDPNQDDYTHTRYNVILSWPERGGESIYGDNINTLEENMVWKCVAGKVKHSSKITIGPKPRITLSLGFLIKDSIYKPKTNTKTIIL
tara:strand:+ start:985 stop:1539 length:555 start_codon:yes stop_codon:yes gene_type:complete